MPQLDKATLCEVVTILGSCIKDLEKVQRAFHRVLQGVLVTRWYGKNKSPRTLLHEQSRRRLIVLLSSAEALHATQ